MKWFITGGLGFIGTNLIKELSKKRSFERDQIFLYDNFSNANFDEIKRILSKKKVVKIIKKKNDYDEKKPYLYVFKGSVEEKNNLEIYAKNFDYLIHLAANTGVQISIQDPMNDCVKNIIGTLNFLNLYKSNKKGKFVIASSGAPVGEGLPPFHEGSFTKPISPYGVSKLTKEGYCHVYNKIFNVNSTAIRFSNVYGLYCKKKSSVVAKMIKDSINKKKITINGNGKQTRDFLFVEDLVKGLIKCVTKNKTKLDSLYQLGSGEELSIKRVFNTVNHLVKKKFHYKVKLEYKAKLKGDVQRNYTIPNKFKKQFNWKINGNFDKNVKKIFNWIANEETNFKNIL